MSKAKRPSLPAVGLDKTMDDLWAYIRKLAEAPDVKEKLKLEDGPDALTKFINPPQEVIAAIQGLKLPHSNLGKLGFIVPPWLASSIGTYYASDYVDHMTIGEWLSKVHCKDDKYVPQE